MATTINTYSVGLAMNAADYINKSRLSAQETRKLTTAINQARNPAEKYSRDLELLDKAVREGAVELPVYSRLVDSLQQKHKQGAYSAEAAARASEKLAAEQEKAAAVARQAAAAQERFVASVDRLARREQQKEQAIRRSTESQRQARAEAERSTESNSRLAVGVRGLVAAYVSFATVRAGARIAADMEQAKISFEIMAGSAEAGLKMFGDIRRFAASTPITLPGAQQAARTMLAFGIANEKVLPTMRALGDISGGNDEQFRGLALAFSQTTAAGRLMGQEVLQMINAGFNPLAEISRTTGRSMADLKKEMELGKISVEMVEQAMMTATTGTGRFAGMMDRMSVTATGAYNQLASSVQEVAGEIGEKLLPTAARAMQMMERMIRGAFDWSKNLEQPKAQLVAMVGAFGATVLIAPKVIAAFVGITKAIAALTKAQVVAQAFTGPKGWAVLAAGAVAAAGALYLVDEAYAGIASEAEKAAAAIDSVGAANRKIEGASRSYKKNIGPVTREFLKMEHSLNEQLKLINLGEEAYKRQQIYQSKLSVPQQDRLLELHRQIKAAEQLQQQQAKVEEDRQRAIEDLKNQAEAAFTRQTTAALDAARKIFDERRKLDEDSRKALRDGPSSMELGSSEAAKWLAQSRNERLGAEKMPALPTPGEAEIVREANKQYEKLVKAEKQREDQLKAFQELVAISRDNGFTRIR